MPTSTRARWILPIGLITAPAWHAAWATQYMSVAEAQKSAFAEADVFQPLPSLDPTIAASLGAAGWSPQMFEVRAGDRRLGWFFVDRVIGKSELITYALAIDEHGAVRSIEVLDYRETHGSEIRLAAWRRQFVGKTSAEPVQLDRDIKGISGATLSCRHVTEGVHRLLQVHERVLRGAT